MQIRTLVYTPAILLMAMILSACNLGAAGAPTPDTGAVQTQAVRLVATQFALQRTQTAAAASATPLPTFTPAGTVTPFTTGTQFVFNTPGAGFTPLASAVPTQLSDPCHQSTFIADRDTPDGTVMNPGQKFEKAWDIQNTGTCEWGPGFVLRYIGGEMKGYDVSIDLAWQTVDPGEVRQFRVNLTAPAEEGEYQDCWKMQDDKGYYFGTYLCAIILVDDWRK